MEGKGSNTDEVNQELKTNKIKKDNFFAAIELAKKLYRKYPELKWLTENAKLRPQEITGYNVRYQTDY